MAEPGRRSGLDGPTLLILAAGVLVDVLCRVVPAQLPYVFPFVFNAPVFYGVWFTLLWYVRGMRATPAAERPGRLRQGFFLLGLALIYFVLQTRFEYLAQHMFFLNRIQAVAIGMLAPFCLGIGWMGGVLARGVPGWVLGLSRSRTVQRAGPVLFHPVVALPIFLFTTDVWLLPSVHFAAMVDPDLYAVMNLSCLLGGLLFWLVVLDPRPHPPARHSYLLRAGIGFFAMFPQIAISSYIALTPSSLYAFYTLCGRLFPGMSPAYDQMLGGMIQWIPPGMMNTVAVIISLNALRLSDIAKEKDAPPIPPGTRVFEAKWTGR